MSTMKEFVLLAQPWWVNLLALVPISVFWFFRRRKLRISGSQLITAGVFGIAFGFVEASVVIYLRAALGFLPGYKGSLSDVVRLTHTNYQQLWASNNLPSSLQTVEFFREIATIVILISVAVLSAKKSRDRVAFFLWTFAFWDLAYYLGLWLTVRWPGSLTANDVLFLIPVPWTAQVWFPFLISGSTIIAIAMNRRGS
ncbi:MAG TPA: hypothetical protein VMV52_02595 [Candidatus Nanopelagicaceae bacterium]|nr:hypothetical protein [Candidatus Nanopelagicaceae bacterium]